MNSTVTRAFTTLAIAIVAGLIWPSVTLAAEPAAADNIATFSVVAYDPSTGEVGVAVQSKFFAVGSVVPWCEAGVGAVASQAYGNPTYGPRGLALMAAGATPEEAIVAVLQGDEEAERRQIGMVSALTGEAATYTGAECQSWAGGKTGVTHDGIVYAVQGNILTGSAVVEAMAMGVETGGAIPDTLLTDNEGRALRVHDFAGRLLAALINGQTMGGDSRGQQSAALRVSQAGMGYGGYTDVKYDLRVDDAEDPFDELARLLNLARPSALITDGYNKAYAGEFDDAFRIFQFLIELDPDDLTHHYHYACALALAGWESEALVHLEIALHYDPSMIGQAREDPDLESLREMDRYKQLVGEE